MMIVFQVRVQQHRTLENEAALEHYKIKVNKYEQFNTPLPTLLHERGDRPSGLAGRMAKRQTLPPAEAIRMSSQQDPFASLREMCCDDEPRTLKRAWDVATVTPETNRKIRWKLPLFCNKKIGTKIPTELLTPPEFGAIEEVQEGKTISENPATMISDMSCTLLSTDIELQGIASELDYTRHVRSTPIESSRVEEDFYHCLKDPTRSAVSGLESFVDPDRDGILEDYDDRDDYDHKQSVSQAVSDIPSPLRDNSQVEFHEKRIEIFPGYVVPLRGSQETWHAYNKGNTISVHCSECQACLHCVDTVTMVLCPFCRDISPVHRAEDEECLNPSVGLGFAEGQFEYL